MTAELALQLCVAALLGGGGVFLAFALPARNSATEAVKRCGAAEKDAGEQRDLRETAERRLASAVAALDAERKSRQARIDEIDQRINEKFAALAAEALGKNSEDFLRLVSERFNQHKTAADKDLLAREEAIATLVKPIGESLAKFEGRVGEIEKAREGAYRAIEEQVKNIERGHAGLRTETSRLVQALRQPKTRGRWGEYQLQNVLEMAGMTEHVDFVTEQSVQSDAGLLRPDVTVRLPGGKSAIIDAKTPLKAYLSAFEADDDEARQRGLLEHARHVREHVRTLASKAYWNALPDTPDFVVMFVPGEAFYDAAARVDLDLVDYAITRRVLIATPTTLIALLKAIAFGWQQERLAENAQAVKEHAHEFYKRIRVFGEHMDNLGKSLRKAVDRYNRGVGSLEARVLPAARKFEQLGAAPSGPRIPDLGPIDLNPRGLQAKELIVPRGRREPSD